MGAVIFPPMCAYGLGRTGAGLGAKGDRRGWEMCEPICSAALLGSFFSLLKKKCQTRCFLFAVPWCPVLWQAGDGEMCRGGSGEGKTRKRGRFDKV